MYGDFPMYKMLALKLKLTLTLKIIFCKYSRKGSSQFQNGTNFIVSMHLEYKIIEFKTNFMTLVQGVFEI